MDSAYVVTLAVLPYQRVVLPYDANAVGSGIAGVATAASCPNGRQRYDARSHHDLASCDELPIKLHQTERINCPYCQWSRGEPPAYPSEQRILHDPAPAQIRPIHQEARPAAQLPRHRILQKQDAGRKSPVLSDGSPRSAIRSGTCAGSIERSHDMRSRARETRIAAMTGRVTSNKPRRITSRWPAAIATSTTTRPITTKNRPRWVSSRQGRDTIAISGQECAQTGSPER